MSFTPQNFVDGVGPAIKAAWLNELDQLANNALQGATTVPALQTILGITSPITFPITIAEGGTGATTLAAAQAALGIGTPATAAETAAIAASAGALAIVNAVYPPGNWLRYGIIPNDVTKATQNSNILNALLNPTIANGPTGLIWSPNTGGVSVPDTWYFNQLFQVRDNVTLDGSGCVWQCNYQPIANGSAGASDNNGFFFLMRYVTIQNVQLYFIVAHLGAAAPPSVSAIFMGGRDGPVPGSALPTIFDSQLVDNYGNSASNIDAARMGNIVLRNIYINATTSDTGQLAGIYGLGGVNHVVMENISIEGNTTMTFGMYYEFGWATSGPVHQRQSSHAHDWHVRNFYCQNLQAGAGSGAFEANGGYGWELDGISASNCGAIVGCSTGESMFLKPWVGVDDFGSLTQNGLTTAAAGRWIVMRNIKGRQINGTAISVGGATWPSGWGFLRAANINPWLPNTTYATNAVVFNGANIYTCTSGGTSSNAAGWQGPQGTGGAITDSGATWSYGATVNSTAYTTVGGTGYNGWQHNTAYVVNDVIINGMYIYICTTPGTSSATQGPTGYGTGLVDGGGGATRWSSVPTTQPSGSSGQNAGQASTDQLSMSLDGFTVDSGTTGTLSGGYGITFTGEIGYIRAGRITNMSRGVSTGGDVVQLIIDGVTVLNSGGDFGMQIGGPTVSIYPAPRQVQGSIRNCFIAGTSTAGAAPGYGIILNNCASFEIANNRFGYEVIHDGIAETTQQYGVFLPVITATNNTQYNGVICRSNYCALAAGGNAYFMYPTTTSNNCAIDDPLGPTQTYAGGWEGVLQSTTPTLTCGTVGDLAVSYLVQKLDYIKRNNKVDFTLEISTTAFTHTTSSGNVIITGLPYSMNNSVVGSLPCFPVTYQGITKAGYTSFAGVTSGAQTTINIGACGSGQSEVTLAITDLPTGGTVKFFMSGMYFTNV
jgi:hypothetical protein